MKMTITTRENLEEETFYFFLKLINPLQPAVDVLLPWQKEF